MKVAKFGPDKIYSSNGLGIFAVLPKESNQTTHILGGC